VEENEREEEYLSGKKEEEEERTKNLANLSWVAKWLSDSGRKRHGGWRNNSAAKKKQR